MNKRLVVLSLGLSLLAGFNSAHADSWCNTRSQCRPLRSQYTANAIVGCIGFSIPLCTRHSGSCGTASANCSWRSCLWGGGTAQATNSAAGCVATKARSGQGIAGIPLADATANPNDKGDSRVQSLSEFDDATKTVTITLTDGYLSSTSGGMPERFSAYIFREDAGAKGDEDEPIRTADNTLWSGSIVVSEGSVQTEGFEAEGISVSQQGELTLAQFRDLRTTIPFDLSDADFENLVVQVVLDEVQLTK